MDTQIMYHNAYARGQGDVIRLILDDLIGRLTNLDKDNTEKISGYKEAINIVRSYR